MLPIHSPFVSGKPVQPAGFIGRQAEVHALFSRIANLESTALVGEPHIGKSSLLLYLADPATREKWLQPNASQWAFVMRDGFEISQELAFTPFWQSILEEAAAQWNDAQLGAEIESRLRSRETLSPEGLRAIFHQIRRAEKNLVLLLDEIDGLLGHKNLAQGEFWGSLRALASTSRALCYVIASRPTLAELNERAEAFKSGGSPFFNIAREIRLKSLLPDEAQRLFERADPERRLPARDHHAILKLAGYHPYLIQLFASLVWERRLAGQPLASEGYLTLATQAVESADAHFGDTWSYWIRQKEASAQLLAIMLTLRELGRDQYRLAQLNDATTLFSKPVSMLESAGVLERVAGEIRLTSGAFAIWVAHNHIQRSLTDPATWLNENERLFGPITRGQIEQAGKALNSVYQEIKDTALDLAGEIARRRLGLN